MPPPLVKVRKHFLTGYTAKNGISNLYILLKSVLKMQEMPFQRPKFQKISGGMPLDPPTIVSLLWPPLTKILATPLSNTLADQMKYVLTYSHFIPIFNNNSI